MGNVVSETQDHWGVLPALDPEQNFSSRLACGRGRGLERRGGASGGRWAGPGEGQAEGAGSGRLRRCRPPLEEREARGWEPRGVGTAAGARAGVPSGRACVGLRPSAFLFAGPLPLCRDAGEPGARRGREVEPAGAANAKLAGAAVPVCARGRAAPLAAAALPAACPRLRDRRRR